MFFKVSKYVQIFLVGAVNKVHTAENVFNDRQNSRVRTVKKDI